MESALKYTSCIPAALALFHLCFAVQAVFAQSDAEMVKYYLITLAFAALAGFILHMSEEA